MKNRPEEKENKTEEECITNKSAFDYTLVLKPDGSVRIKDECGNVIKDEGSSELPPIKKIINTRTLTIMEAEGSQWIFLYPPGRWYKLS